jgi:hypothetical protein
VRKKYLATCAVANKNEPFGILLVDQVIEQLLNLYRILHITKTNFYDLWQLRNCAHKQAHMWWSQAHTSLRLEVPKPV